MDNKKKVEDLYKLIEQRRLHLVNAEADIKNYRNLIKELEAEKSPAEEFASGIFPVFTDSFSQPQIVAAHEAGQQYEADQEKEKYGPLIEAAGNAAKFLKDGMYYNTCAEVLQALDNLNHKPEEKPEIVGFFLRSAFHKNDPHKEITFLVDHDSNLTNKKYLLTPIKEK